MKKKFNFLAIILIFLFTISMIGCGEDDTVEIESVDPPDGSTIPTEATITISFSKTPQSLTVSEGKATTSDRIVTIVGPFTLGKLEIEVAWEDGNQTLTFTVENRVGESIVPANMALIPQGEFQLGSIGGEAGTVEQPGHTVFLDAFYIDKYEQDLRKLSRKGTYFA